MQVLATKTAVVTGAASGIGLALARRLGAEGMRVVLADVEEEALAERASEVFGAVHLVCNNAGVFAGGNAWEVSAADWEWVLGVNLWGVIHGLRSFVPRLLAHGEAERNRPGGASQGSAETAARALVRSALQQAVGRGLAPEVMAERVVRAVRERRFYVLAEDDWRRAVELRSEDVRLARNPSFKPPSS